MSRIPCPIDGCDHPARSGYMCGGCEAELRRALDAVPEVVRELETTLAKQHTRTGGGGGDIEDDRAAAVLHIGPLPYDARASEAMWVLRTALVGWVRAMEVEPREGPVCATCTHPSCRLLPYSRGPVDTCQGMAAWLSAGLQRLVRHPAAEEAHGEIVSAVAAAERVVDRPAERQFAGRCPGCGAELYAKAGAAMAQCREQECDGGAVKVSDQKAVMLDRLGDHLATATQAADILTRLVAPLSAELVRQWIKRRKFLPHGSDASGRPLYRVADVAKELGDKLKRDAENEEKRRAKAEKVAS